MSDDLESKMNALIVRAGRVEKKKNQHIGEMRSKKEELTKLVEEIKAAGFDPRTIKEDRDKAQMELEALISEFSKDVDSAEKILNEFDK